MTERPIPPRLLAKLSTEAVATVVLLELIFDEIHKQTTDREIEIKASSGMQIAKEFWGKLENLRKKYGPQESQSIQQPDCP